MKLKTPKRKKRNRRKSKKKNRESSSESKSSSESNSSSNDYDLKKSSAKKFDLQFVDTLNRNQIYSITLLGKHYYLYRDNKDYLLLLNYSDYPHIIKFEDSIDGLDEFKIEGIKRALTSQNNMDEQLETMGIKLYDFNKIYSDGKTEIEPEEMYLLHARKRIEDLNLMLQDKEGCNDFTIELNYCHSINLEDIELANDDIEDEDLILCLNNSKGCISHIIIKHDENDENTLVISSKTNSDYRNKKYNKLLRCVVIIISELLYTNIEKIVSNAENPISAYLLITYFNGTILDSSIDFFKYLKTNRIDINKVKNYKLLFEKFKKHSGFNLDIKVDINPSNVQNAIAKFDEILNEISC